MIVPTMYSNTFLIFTFVYFLSDSSHGQIAKKFFRSDYSYIEAVESFYKFHLIPQTWSDAQRICAQEGAIIWHPDNDNEAQAVLSFWNTNHSDIPFVFTGLTDRLIEGQFETADGKLESQVFNKWLSGQPDDYDGAEDCVHFNKLVNGEGILTDTPCERKDHFICKKSLQSLEQNGNIPDTDGQIAQNFFRSDYSYIEAEESFYKFHSIPQTWSDAKQICAQEGGIIWHPDNGIEAQAVLSFWNTNHSDIPWVYTGLTDRLVEGQFETTDGKSEVQVFNEWLSGQPDDYGGAEDCVHFNKHINREGVLSDTPCERKDHFICKKSLQSLEWNDLCNISYTDYIFSQETGKCYKFHTTPLKWTDAYAMCQREQTSLVVINNLLEADYLANLTDFTEKPRIKENYQRGMYHIGIHNIFNEGWQTVKGTPLHVDADVWWDNYQPDDRNQCGSMFYTGRLINIDCDMKSFFICEHELDTQNSPQMAEETF